MADQTPTLYSELKRAGCQIEGYESDLYVRATEKACRIIQSHKQRFSAFISPVDATAWYEVPFAYQPYWDERVRQAEIEQRAVASDQAEADRVNKGGSL